MEEEKLKSMTAVEIIVTYISVGWAFVMFTDPNVLVNTWALLGSIANHLIFGGIALVCSLIKIIGLALDNLKIRSLGLTASAFFWTFVSVCNLFADGNLSLTTGFIVYSGVAVLCLWTSKELSHGREE